MISGVETEIFSIYQNPTEGEVYVDFNDCVSKSSFKVLNTQGRTVIENSNPVIRNTISLKKLPAGIYTMKVKSENKVIIKNFLKL
ncbi:T9SS type A sorting domain-containing protein [Aquimarina sp. 2304DJ70-9]|uniref:T9SS type A sorting domain-containing protein n=1 Tax=Aquimarina penaris TaxID=3231044 RepID=UPI00346343F3